MIESMAFYLQSKNLASLFDRLRYIVLCALMLFSSSGHVDAVTDDSKVHDYVSSLINAGTCKPGWRDDFKDCVMLLGHGADETYRQLQESVQKLKTETISIAIVRRESPQVASVWFLEDPEGENSPILFYVDLGAERLCLKKMFQWIPCCGFSDYVDFDSERNNWLATTFAGILDFDIKNYPLPNGDVFKLDRMLESWGTPLELDAEVVVRKLLAINPEEYAKRFIFLESNEEGLRLCFTIGRTDYAIGIVKIDKGSFIYVHQEY